MSETMVMNDFDMRSDKLLTISEGMMNIIKVQGEQIAEQGKQMGEIKKEISSMKVWLYDTTQISPDECDDLLAAIRAKVKEQVGYPSPKFKKAIKKCHNDLEKHGKAGRTIRTKKINLENIYAALANWVYIDYDA